MPSQFPPTQVALKAPKRSQLWEAVIAHMYGLDDQNYQEGKKMQALAKIGTAN